MTAIHDALQIGPEIAVPVFRFAFPEWRRQTHRRFGTRVAGVVHEQADGSKLRVHRTHDTLDRSMIAYIGGRRHRPDGGFSRSGKREYSAV